MTYFMALLIALSSLSQAPTQAIPEALVQAPIQAPLTAPSEALTYEAPTVTTIPAPAPVVEAPTAPTQPTYTAPTQAPEKAQKKAPAIKAPKAPKKAPKQAPQAPKAPATPVEESPWMYDCDTSGETQCSDPNLGDAWESFDTVDIVLNSTLVYVKTVHTAPEELDGELVVKSVNLPKTWHVFAFTG